jgi:hypothetical protein
MVTTRGISHMCNQRLAFYRNLKRIEAVCGLRRLDSSTSSLDAPEASPSKLQFFQRTLDLALL